MIDATLTIAITRDLLPGSLPPLLFSASLDGTPLGIVGYQAPPLSARLGYMPSHPDVDGAELTSAAYEKVLLNFDWMRDLATTETQVQAAYAEVRAAISQFQFLVTTQVSGAPAEVWAADRGNMTSPARSFIDLTNLCPVYSVAIPVQPIPGAP